MEIGNIITINKKEYQIEKSDHGCDDCNYKRYELGQFPCRKCPKIISNSTKKIKLVLCGKKDK